MGADMQTIWSLLSEYGGAAFPNTIREHLTEWWDRGTAQTPIEADRARILQRLRCAELEAQIKDCPSGSLSLQDVLRVIDCLWSKYGPLEAVVDPVKSRRVKNYLASHLSETLLAQDPALLQRLRPLIEKNHHAAAVRQEQRNREQEERTNRRADLLALVEGNVARFIPDLPNERLEDIRWIILEAPDSFSAERQLFDKFGAWNWDWQPIVGMEMTMLYADRFLVRCCTEEYSTRQVRWLVHPGACRFCREMNGRVFTVVDPNMPGKDPLTQVWVGKAADLARGGFGPYSRVIRPSQRKPPVIPYCRRCRCSWVPQVEIPLKP